MTLLRSLKYLVPCVSAVLFASCSYDTLPSSVNSSNKPLTTAAISDLAIRDMGWAGGQLWAVSLQSRGSDYYLARFSSSTNQWQVLTSYYGQRCAVSNSGKCYYVNSAGQIWWITKNSNGTYTNQRITTLPSNKYARDISAGTYEGKDRIWVKFRDNAGNYTIYRADYSGSGSSVIGGSSGWTQEFIWGGAPKCISTSPFNGFMGYCISEPNYINIILPGDCHAGEIDGLNCNFVDMATCDGDWLIVSDDQKLYKGDEHGTFAINTFAKASVGMTKINGILYAMYINSSNRLEYLPFDDLPPVLQ